MIDNEILGLSRQPARYIDQILCTPVTGGTVLQILSVEDAGKLLSLPPNRRHQRATDVEEAERLYSLKPLAEKRSVQNIDDAFIKSEGGRVIGVNLEKAIQEQNEKLKKLGY